jgi:hypothetical protein
MCHSIYFFCTYWHLILLASDNVVSSGARPDYLINLAQHAYGPGLRHIPQCSARLHSGVVLLYYCGRVLFPSEGRHSRSRSRRGGLACDMHIHCRCEMVDGMYMKPAHGEGVYSGRELMGLQSEKGAVRANRRERGTTGQACAEMRKAC